MSRIYSWGVAILYAFVAPAALAEGDYGPSTCMEGYVWRQACSPEDHVCVDPKVRDQAQDDNLQAPYRVNPSGGPFGRDTCIPPFVWREACPTDHVCVELKERGQAQADNRESERRLKYPYCKSYAEKAVRAQGLNMYYRCGFTGNRWQGSYQNHFRWCLSESNDIIGKEERIRLEDLMDCNDRAESDMAGGSRPSPVDSHECCLLPVQGPYGIEIMRTCGPQCH